jgi:hypothetical protein
MTKVHSSCRHGVALAVMLFLGCFGLSSAVRAQDNSPDPKSLALSAQLLELAGVKDTISQMLDRLTPSLTQLLQQANPGKEQEVADVMVHFIVPKMKDSLPTAMQQCAAVYAKHFGADELNQLIAFYQSPLGQKLVQAQPQIILEMSQIGSAWAQAAAVEAIHDYADEFRKRGLQTPI